MSGTTTFYGVTYPTSTDYVKDGATAIQTVATGFDSAVAIPTYNAQTGATYTFVLSDTGKTVTASNASAQTYTIPPTASVAWTASTTLRVLNLGAGVVTFAAGAGVTVTNTAQTLAQYQSANLVRTGLNAWTVVPKSGSASSGASGLTLIAAQTIGSAVSSVNVTSAFSATYDNYKIIISGGAASVSDNVNIQFGATVTGYYSARPRVTLATGAISANATVNGTSLQFGSCDTSGFAVNADVMNPFLTTLTRCSVPFWIAATTIIDQTFGFLNNSTSYTAFTLTPTSGTWTGGTIYVYGYIK